MDGKMLNPMAKQPQMSRQACVWPPSKDPKVEAQLKADMAVYNAALKVFQETQVLRTYSASCCGLGELCGSSTYLKEGSLERIMEMAREGTLSYGVGGTYGPLGFIIATTVGDAGRKQLESEGFKELANFYNTVHGMQRIYLWGAHVSKRSKTGKVDDPLDVAA